jgi:hypothetical protein
MHELGPSYAGSVILDIGGDVGALVIHAEPGSHLREIEISRTDNPHAPRTHAAVRERRLPGEVAYLAVYPGLPRGEYVVWAAPTTPAGTVVVVGGEISEYRLGASETHDNGGNRAK